MTVSSYALIVTLMNKPDKILVLFGSPNKQGFTNSLLRIYLEQLQNRIHNASDVKIVNAFEKNYLPCNGCKQCENTGVCVFNNTDGYDKLLKSIYEANYVIIASPVYFHGFPSPLKALIDRAQQRYCVKFGGKIKQPNKKLNCGVLIASCGADSGDFIAPLTVCARMFFDCLDIGFTEKLFALNTDNPENIRITDS